MNSKLEKRAFFDWQKSSDEYLFSIALLVGLFAVRNEFSEKYNLAIYFILATLIFLSGWGLIRTKSLEINYLRFLKDKRYKENKWDVIKEWILFLFYILLGSAIVYFSMNIWKEMIHSLFNAQTLL
jgi:heme A synthase